MNYGQIISQAWQIVKRTKLLWVFGLLYFLTSFNKLYKTEDLSLQCMFLLTNGLLLFLRGFSQVGTLLCADKGIREETPFFNDIWHAYKTNFGRLILLYLVILIPVGILFLCALLLIAPIFNLSNNAINDTPTRLLLASLISGPFTSGISTFSFYGLLLHRMGVLRSVRHGLSVFSMNWFKFVILCLFLTIPSSASYLIFWLILFLAGNHPTLATLFQEASKYPVHIGFVFIDSVITLFSSIAFLLAYYQFIKEYDYPTLKQVTPTT